MSLFSRTRIIGSSLLTFALAASAAFSQPDVMMRDCINDNGDIVAPGYNCGGAIYYSPDVWIRLNADYGTVDQAPIAGSPAYVHVSLYNRGDKTSSCGVLCLYYRDASTGLTDWPTHWLNYAPGGIVRGDAIGKIDVCDMAPGETRTVIVPWASVPANQYTGSHHCLMARWIASDDPMQTTETSSFYANVVGNNNVVHRNCIPTQPGSGSTPVSVFNTKDEDVKAQLTFKALPNGEKKTVFDDLKGFAVKITLDDETYDNWDKKGTNIETNDEEHSVTITKADAVIDGLDLPAAEGNEYRDIIVDVDLQYPEDLPEGDDRLYVWTMEQRNTKAGDLANQAAAAAAEAEAQVQPFDGIAFEIHTVAEDNGEGAARRNVAPTMSPNMVNPEISAHPNIMKGSTDILYSLEQKATVTLVITDINGRPVRTLLAGSETAAGNHQIEWDGKAADGSLVPGGTYFYRLITPSGSVERQLRMVR